MAYGFWNEKGRHVAWFFLLLEGTIRRQIHDLDLLGFDVVVSGHRPLEMKRCRDQMWRTGVERGLRTISLRGADSLSGVITVLWMRNLSLHLVLRGGSSFIACSITGSFDEG